MNKIPPVRLDLERLSLEDSIRLVGVADWARVKGLSMVAPGWSAVWHPRQSVVSGSGRTGAWRPSITGGVLAPIAELLMAVRRHWQFLEAESRRIAWGSRLIRGNHEEQIEEIRAVVNCWLRETIELSKQVPV